MDFIDYYKILEIDKSATQDEIKKAYRKLARKLHPDLNPNNADAKLNFQKINEANNVLSDPEKRKKYDQHGQDWKHADEYEKARRAQSSQQRARSSSQSDGDFSDFFESMFGGSARGGRQVQFRGEDFQASLQLSLLDTYTTQQQTLTVNGKSIRITIPAGIENEQTIKIKNHGGPGINGGPNGDLYITFSIASHPDFKRLGNDLYTTKELDLYTAILGGELIVDTLSGKVKLKVKPETQNGEKVKLKGKGFPVYKKEGVFGDLYVTYNVKIPTGLTDKQKELFTELSNS
jgi:curved DNA-binding protein